MPSLEDVHTRHRPHVLIVIIRYCRNHEQMSAEILDLIVAQIEERKGQDYAEAVLPPHQARFLSKPDMMPTGRRCAAQTTSSLKAVSTAAVNITPMGKPVPSAFFASHELGSGKSYLM